MVNIVATRDSNQLDAQPEGKYTSKIHGGGASSSDAGECC